MCKDVKNINGNAPQLGRVGQQCCQFRLGFFAQPIKGQQLDLFADRTSTAKLWSNQSRLYFSSCASLLLQALRRLSLHGTEMAHAQCGTIRLHLLKIGALPTVSARRIRVALASGYPYATLFQQVYAQLRC